MATTCSGCGKFASLEEGDPEIDEGSEDIDDTGDGAFAFGVGVRIVRNSTCCGEEMKEANLQLEFSGQHECEIKEAPNEDERYEVYGYDVESTDRYQTIDRKGNLITRSRYQTHYIGADVTAHVTCLWCHATIDAQCSVEEQASNFDEV